MVIEDEDTIWRLLKITDLKINKFVKFGGKGGLCIKVSHNLHPEPHNLQNQVSTLL
jgi:hypothetical protein